MKTRVAAISLLAVLVAGCRGASYAPKAEGCPVKSYVGTPDIPVDDLGDVSVDCSGDSRCARHLMDAVCAKGGDVLWGLGDNAVTSLTMRGHAAHASRKNWAPRAGGCDVKVYETNPTVATENIGRVSASCGLDISDADCLRQLEDQVCTLGGDVVWGVGPPIVDQAKKKLAGRAAHTK